MRFLSVTKACILSTGVFMAMTLGLQSCQENIDDSAFAIKTEQTLADYLQTNEEFSEIHDIFSRVALSMISQKEIENQPLSTVPVGGGDNAPIISALSARGHYTVFAPTNTAVDAYVADCGKSNYLDLTVAEAAVIARSCVIDNGSDNAYESPDFYTDGSAFGLPDLNERLITCKMDSLGNYVLNGTSVITKTDIKLSNGFIHVIGGENAKAIAPSNQGVADLIREAGNMKGMTYLLDLTGWADAMNPDVVDLDEEYERVVRDQTLNIKNLATFNIAQHRYQGFTGFIETDDVYEAELGVSVSDQEAFLKAITTLAEQTYGTEDRGDYTSPRNAVNRFVAYHFLDAKVAYNNLVRHFNEFGYKYGEMRNPQTNTLSVDVWDYYATAGQYPALLKVSQDGDKPERATSHNMYLNRVSKYKKADYETIPEQQVSEGILIDAYNNVTNGEEVVNHDNNAKNGFYYPIHGILINNAATQAALSSERIRFDITTILPELLSNNVRGGVYTHFPNGYFNNITNENADTKLLYLNSAAVGGTAWRDYQGDEFMACGVFDFVLKLPPVPADGTYEFRMGVSHNSLRGMAQLYIGNDPNNLQPAGLPYDMRQGVLNNDNIGFVADGGDEASNAEIDRNMRNHGFMKAPRYFQLPDGTGTSTVARLVEVNEGVIRRIVVQQEFKKDMTYYVRFKSALEQSDAQFFLDYFEFCPSSVYNGTTPEDQW